MTLHLRADVASENALHVANYLDRETTQISNVRYPGLAAHPDHTLAGQQLQNRYGSVVTFDLVGGATAAEAFIQAVGHAIPFSPSLGEVSTTLSHPASTSHRNLTATEQAAIGIHGGTIRLSVGTESPGWITEAIRQTLSGLS